MISDYHHFLNQHKKTFEDYVVCIRHRLSEGIDLSWCMTYSDHPFVADYLFINSLSSTRFQRFLQFFLRPFKWIWLLVMPRLICYQFLKRFFEERCSLFFSKLTDEQVVELRFFLSTSFTWLRRKTPFYSLSFLEMMSWLICSVHAYMGYIGLDASFKNEKQGLNRYVYDLLEPLLDELIEKNSLDHWLYMVTRFNWLDDSYAFVSTIMQSLPDDINDCLDSEAPKELLEATDWVQYEGLEHYINGKSKTILYECDNHGEIVMDLMFIKWLCQKGHRVILSAKRSIFLKDVTYEDFTWLIKEAWFIALFKPLIDSQQLQMICSVDVGVKSMYEATDAYKVAYQQADLIFLKGQLNFQTQPIFYKHGFKIKSYGYHKPRVHLMGIKSVITQWCFESVKLKKPPIETFLMKFYR